MDSKSNPWGARTNHARAPKPEAHEPPARALREECRFWKQAAERERSARLRAERVNAHRADVDAADGRDHARAEARALAEAAREYDRAELAEARLAAALAMLDEEKRAAVYAVGEVRKAPPKAPVEQDMARLDAGLAALSSGAGARYDRIVAESGGMARRAAALAAVNAPPAPPVAAE